MESKFKYRVLKSSWGIAIDVTASFIFDTPTPQAMKITDNIYLAFEGFTLPEEHSLLVAKGVQMMADHISDGAIHLPVTVQLTELWFNPCDFLALWNSMGSCRMDCE